MNPPPLSLYVHLPWCVRKCPYCDFNSHTAGEDASLQCYVDALLADLEYEAERGAGRQIETVFLGGGTPSLFAADQIARLLSNVRTLFRLAEDAEITMEANPGTVECGDPAGYRAAGVNRLSIGGQSFNDEFLKKLGRIHCSDDIKSAVHGAQAAGFDNLNIDLMHGLPGQSIEAALDDISTAIALGPTHISWYQLTLEPNTVFFARPPAGLPDDDKACEIQDRGQALLASGGFGQYEVSAYARDSHACRHNRNYWQFGDYLAVGAGAHGKITSRTGAYRYVKPANPLQYMKEVEAGEQLGAPKAIPADDLVFEFMLNSLRLSEGFSESLFCDRTGRSADEIARIMRSAGEKGLILRDSDSYWRPTELGRRFLNDLQAEFLPGQG